MDAATEAKQWRICRLCGATTILDERVIANLISKGRTEAEAREYASANTYRICPERPNHGQRPILRPPFVDGAYYHGSCRNASIARYVAATNRFVYMREKFGHVYPESIGHTENDQGFDLFRPYGILENPPFEIPQLTDR